MKSRNSGKNHPKFIDLTGKIIGQLEILEYVLHKGRGTQNRWVWKCKCSCGEYCFVRTTKLTKENPQNCCKKCSDKKFSQNNILEDYGSIKNRVYRRYKKGAKNRNYIFNLSFKYFTTLLNQDCYYCGAKPVPYDEDKFYYNGLQPFKRNGIDRKDNTKGYTIENCVSCCKQCNTIKMNLSYDDFLEKIKSIYNNLIKESSTTIPNGSTFK